MTKSKIFINFKFNGWSKYKNFKKDNKVNLVIHKKTQIRKIEPRIKIKNRYKKIILEGGAIDVNGKAVSYTHLRAHET